MAEWTEGKDTYDESEDFGPANYTLDYQMDEYDYRAVQEAIAFRQSHAFWREKDGSLILPDGEGDLGGRILAQICRDYVDTLDVPASRNEDQKHEMKEHGLTEAEAMEVCVRTLEVCHGLRVGYRKAQQRLHARYLEVEERKRAEIRTEILGRRGEGE
jgi:hypothetical protein